MEEIIWEKGKPTNIRCDNGSEFISHEFQEWCDGNGIKILYTQPGCLTQNSYIERFNGSYRRAVLDAYIFRTRLLKQPRSNGVSVDENWVVLYTLNQS